MLFVLYAGSRSDGVRVERVKINSIKRVSHQSLKLRDKVVKQSNRKDVKKVIKTPRSDLSKSSIRVSSRAPVCIRFSVLAKEAKGDVYLIMNKVPQAVDRDGMEQITLQKRDVYAWRMIKENDMCWSRTITANIGESM